MMDMPDYRAGRGSVHMVLAFNKQDVEYLIEKFNHPADQFDREIREACAKWLDYNFPPEGA